MKATHLLLFPQTMLDLHLAQLNSTEDMRENKMDLVVVFYGLSEKILLEIVVMLYCFENFRFFLFFILYFYALFLLFYLSHFPFLVLYIDLVIIIFDYLLNPSVFFCVECLRTLRIFGWLDWTVLIF